MTYQHVARAVFDTPWMIRDLEGRIVAQLVAERLAGGRLSDDEIVARIEAAQAAQGPRRGQRTTGSIAILPVYGVLMPRANLMAALSGGTSVEQLRAGFREVMGDETVGSIVFDVDSPGGAVDGIEEFAAEIRAARGQKPMVAVANTLMASAAYYLAAQADEIVASPSSLVGSIGVYMEHLEESRALDEIGVTPTIIRRPTAKNEANDLEPLSDEARAHLQQIVDDYYDQFVSAVAKGRGTTPAAVRGGYGEGRVLTASRALEAKLVDRVGTLDDTLVRLAKGKGPAPRAAAYVPVPSTALRAELEAERAALIADGVEPTELDEVEATDRGDHTDEPADRSSEAAAALGLARARAGRR